MHTPVASHYAADRRALQRLFWGITGNPSELFWEAERESRNEVTKLKGDRPSRRVALDRPAGAG
jgi:hypothetical protein